MPRVGIVMGSDSDLPILKQTAEILEHFGIDFEMTIISAHRSPQKAVEYGSSAVDRGLEVIIAGAGGAAVTASGTPRPPGRRAPDAGRLT